MAKSSDKSADDPVLAEYARLADGYDRRWSFYIEATVGQTLRRLDVGPGERLLDVGCGTGALLKALSAAAPQADFTGVDPSPEMLRIARERLGPAVRLQDGRAEELPFPADGFDVVVSTNVFHYFRRPLAALSEMARVLKPGGRLVITDWCDDYLACRICDVLLRLFNRAHYRTYGRKSCRRLLDDSEFRAIEIERYKINWLWGLMTVKARKGG